MAQESDPATDMRRGIIQILSAALAKVDIGDVTVLVTETNGDGGVHKTETTIRQVLRTRKISGEDALDFIQCMFKPDGRWELGREKGKRFYAERSVE